MATSRSSRLLLLVFAVLPLIWAAAAGVLAKGRGDDPFPRAAAVDARFSARPGINLSREDLTGGSLDATLAQLAEQGITFVRFTLPWDEIEPGRGEFAWETWDRVMDAFASHPSLRPVVVLDRSPAWARSSADVDNPLAPPHERRDFGAFARAVAERYGDRVAYYQVWDEPNIAPHWGFKPADPADYAGLLREAAVNLRASDGDAQVIAAALSPTTEGGGANLSDLAYLDQLYALGARAWFDYPAIQPYGFSSSPAGGPDASRLDFSRAGLLRSVMLRHDDGDTPLWATSFGWDTAVSSPFGNVSPGDQPAYTRVAFQKAQREWSWLGPLFWTGKFPMLPATRDVVSQAGAAPQLLGPGRHSADSPALHYNGWRITPSAADPSSDGDTLDFTFSGTGVALDVQGGLYWAYLTAKIDGGAANRLPRDESGASYLVLHDPGAAKRLVPLAEGLPSGQHSVRLTAHGGWGQWPLRAVVVTQAGRSSNRLGLAALVLALLASAAVGVVAFRSRGLPANRAFPRHAAEPLPATAAVRPSSGRVVTLAVWALATVLCVLYLLSDSGLINLVILALFGLLFLARPELAPPLIGASLPWWQQTQPVLRWQFGLFEVLTWLALLAWLARSSVGRLMNGNASLSLGGWSRWGRGSSRLPVALDISILGLFAAGLLATIVAAEQGVAWREFRIVFLFGLVLYFLITRATGEDYTQAGRLVAGLLAGATVASLAGLWQLVTGQGRVNVEGVGRIAAFYGSPNNLALILDRAVPLAVALALFGLPLVPGRAAASLRLARLVLAVVSAIMLVAAVATFSKGAVLLGLPVGLAVVLIGGAWRTRRRWPLLLLVVLTVVGSVGLILLFRTPRFADLLNFESGTSFFRLKLWRGALNMALDHPLLGVGPDNFLYAYRTRYVLPSAWQELNLSHPHNILLDLLTRLGLIGLTAGIFALVTAFVSGLRLLRASTDVSQASTGLAWPLILGLLAGLAATVAHGLIDNFLFLPDLVGWFVSALAIFWLYLTYAAHPAEARQENLGEE